MSENEKFGIKSTSDKEIEQIKTVFQSIHARQESTKNNLHQIIRGDFTSQMQDGDDRINQSLSHGIKPAYRIRSSTRQLSQNKKAMLSQQQQKNKDEEIKKALKHFRIPQAQLKQVAGRAQSSYNQKRMKEEIRSEAELLNMKLKIESEKVSGPLEVQYLAHLGMKTSTHLKQQGKLPQPMSQSSHKAANSNKNINQFGKTAYQQPPLNKQNRATSSRRYTLGRIGGNINIFIQEEKNQVEGVKQKLLQDLYEAKCLDLQLNTQKEQEKRFFDYCSKVIQKRKISMRECGLGLNSAKVIGFIIAGDYFSHLDIGKNNLGDQGIQVLLKGMNMNRSLIHLDVGSNDLTFEGANKLFLFLQKHPTITSITLANHDRLHRNRIGAKACFELTNLLDTNKIISMVNIADNGITNEGLKVLSYSLNDQSSLISLNLSNNDLIGSASIDSLKDLIRYSRSISELILSHNKIGEAGIQQLATYFSENSSRLQRLDLTNCGVTALSAGKLFYALKSNSFMKELVLDNNELSGDKFSKIQNMLWNNRHLQKLSMANCKLESEGAKYIAEGLVKNQSLQYLDISHNRFKACSFKRWQDVLGKSGLLHLDVSQNDLDNEGCNYIIQGLQNLNENQEQSTLQILLMKCVQMKNESGQNLILLLTKNSTLKRVNVENNLLYHRYIEEIAQLCQRNKDYHKKSILPKYTQELDQLFEINKGEGGQMLQKRKTCYVLIDDLVKERKEKVNEIYQGEEILSVMREADEESQKEFLKEKEANEKYMEKLDKKLAKMDKKMQNQENWVNEQFENVNKRMEFLSMKSEKINNEIKKHRGMIAKENSKYDSIVDELKGKLEELEKSARTAEILHRTYIDQIAREKEKMEKEEKEHETVLQKHENIHASHSHNFYSKEVEKDKKNGKLKKKKQKCASKPKQKKVRHCKLNKENMNTEISESKGKREENADLHPNLVQCEPASFN